MLKRLFARKPRRPAIPDNLSYGQARDILEREGAASRTELARRQDVRPEILYYLAEDVLPEVRRIIAANPTTPMHAHEILAGDGDDDVRYELARKIARLLPDLDPVEKGLLREQMIEILDRLAQDQLPRVRHIIAEEIKHSDRVPHAIVRKLASDVELIVCAPILEYSPMLNDTDLREIIATTTADGALAAISKRSEVSEPVADAIAATLDVPAVAALLANPNAQIREGTLDQIIDQAEAINEWHEPMVMRPSLSVRAIRRIAGFVASSLLQTMIERHDLDDALAEDLLKRVRKRLKKEPEAEREDQEAAVEAKASHDAGELDDSAIGHALDANQRDFVIHATALLARATPELVVKILESGNGRVITALAWKAGLAMRTALRLQRELANLPPADLVNAKDGLDYPFSEQEMSQHLSYFGV